MSDLAATNCGCGNDVGNGCSSIIWIILLLCICGNNGNSGFNNGGCGGDNGCLWIILLLLFCGGGCGGGNGFF